MLKGVQGAETGRGEGLRVYSIWMYVYNDVPNGSVYVSSSSRWFWTVDGVLRTFLTHKMLIYYTNFVNINTSIDVFHHSTVIYFSLKLKKHI